MPTLKERIQSLTQRISQSKISLRDALRNKGVDPGSQPSFEALRLGIICNTPLLVSFWDIPSYNTF